MTTPQPNTACGTFFSVHKIEMFSQIFRIMAIVIMECFETIPSVARRRKRTRSMSFSSSSSSSSGEDDDDEQSLTALQALLLKQRCPHPFEEASSSTPEEEVSYSSYYTASAVLGEGRFGTVFAALNTKTNTPCAIKWVPPRHHNGCNSLMREAEALHLVRPHPGFVHLQRYLLCGRELLLVLERCECDLVQHLRSQPKQGDGLPFAEIENFLEDMLGALAFLHDTLEFVHRDLKPSNMLVAAVAGRRALKISDLGTACPVSEIAGEGGHVCGTYTFCAPEFLLGMPDYGTAVDLWSAGVTLSVMLHNGGCFSQSESNTQFETLICVFRVFGTPTEASWPGVATALPHFFPEFPRLAPAPKELDFLFAPRRYRCDAAAALLSVLRGLLQPCPAHRLTAHKALSLLRRRK